MMRRSKIAAAQGGLLGMLLLIAACAGEPDRGAVAAASPSDADAVETARPPGPLTDRVWVRADSSELPGRMRIFLSSGTLVMDSCWETYRLAAWARSAGDTLRWSEDGQEIRAVVTEESETALALRLLLVDGPHEERYRPAQVPFVCPDMPR